MCVRETDEGREPKKIFFFVFRCLHPSFEADEKVSRAERQNKKTKEERSGPKEFSLSVQHLK